MRVLVTVIVKEFLQLRRDRKMIPAMIVGPLVQLIALGFAANMDVTEVPTLLVDRDRSPESRRLVDRFVESGYFRPVGAAADVDESDRWLMSGRASVVLVIEAGFGRSVAAGRPAAVQMIADGTDANSATVGLGYSSRVVAEAGGELVRRARGAAAPVGQVGLAPRVWYNPDLKSRWFFVPGILAMTLMLTTMIMPSMAVVREKEIGTLEQVSVTPVRAWQLILGKLFPFAVIGMVVLVLVTILAVALFRVPLRGSFVTLAAVTFLFLLTTLGLGLLVSTAVRTQQQAMMSASFVLMVPMIYLSGLIFPVENMPRVLQFVARGIPLLYYNAAVRGIFLKGSGLVVLWPEAAVLAGTGIAVLTLASLRFRKSLD